MTLGGRLYVLLATIVIVAMVSRVGWINWLAIGRSAEVVGTVLLILFVFSAIFLGIPAALILATIKGISLFFPKPTAPTPPGPGSLSR